MSGGMKGDGVLIEDERLVPGEGLEGRFFDTKTGVKEVGGRFRAEDFLVSGEVVGVSVGDEGEGRGSVGVEQKLELWEVEGFGVEVEGHEEEVVGVCEFASLECGVLGLGMKIREAMIGDLSRIVEIYNESIPGGRATADLEEISVESRMEWFEEFESDRRPCWVGEVDGEVVGCVYLRSFYAGRPAYDKTAEISTYVAKDWQRRGIGRGLKEAMIEACPGLGVENLLSFYFDHNEATRRLNERLGFVQVGHLEGIAEVFGERRGLKIGLLRV